MRAQLGPLTRASAAIRLVAAAALLFLAACSPEVSIQRDAPTPAPAYTTLEESGKGWWRLYFRMAWDQEEQPDWHVDVLLADQILAPIIAHAEPRISLWRFHRRAAQDDHGHRFSFIFYADAETADIVNNGVERSQLVLQLMDSGVVEELRTAELDQAAAQNIGATSDPAWPEALRRGWPWFIMGVSQSWLRLIDEAKKAEPPPDRSSLENVLDYYRGVHQAVSTLWREHGQHAYLHHLNAVFGYQLLIIQETNLKRF